MRPDLLRLLPAEPAVAPVAIAVQGSKNGFNHAVAVALLGGPDAELVLHRAPDNADRAGIGRLFAGLGLRVAAGPDFVATGGPLGTRLPDAPARRLRVSICYGAAVAARLGSAWLPAPGGDAFTERPIDLHLQVLAAAGADLSMCTDGVRIEFRRPPRAFEVDLSGPYGTSMGASVTALLVAATADGRSVLHSLSAEPEVGAVIEVLRDFGVGIEADGERVLVDGVGGPLSGRVEHTVPGDRMEAATYALIGAARGCKVRLDGIGMETFTPVLREALTTAGLLLHELPGPATGCTLGRAAPVLVTTAPHPGFPSDLQPPLAAYLALTPGTSRIEETVYAVRTSHVAELARLGLRIEVRGRIQVIRGPQRPHGGSVTVTDIRAGAALLVAAAASGEPTWLHDPDGHLERGYSRLTDKLRMFGLRADWVADPDALGVGA